MILYALYVDAIFFPCHPYIWSTTVLHDIGVSPILGMVSSFFHVGVSPITGPGGYPGRCPLLLRVSPITGTGNCPLVLRTSIRPSVIKSLFRVARPTASWTAWLIFFVRCALIRN